MLVLAGIALFWSAILVAAALEPGYTHRRDYVSTLAARGAEYGELAMFAIVAAAAAMLFAAFLVRHLSRLAGAAIAIAGVGFVVAAFTRLECANGAAGCGLGGRFEISGSTEIGHWTATTVSSILLIGGIALTGIALIRRGRRISGVASLAAAAVTAGAFLATGGENPGVMQRIGIVVGTGWLAAFAIVTLARRRST
ncbi:MAG TPA: DUF998 domain-containing protein [Solirubrobacteraceae bacterium]|nr:DUF998 domain-containing protein [Solirubrobacteraceae bacterium]